MSRPATTSRSSAVVRRLSHLIFALVVCAIAANSVRAQEAGPSTADKFLRAITLQDYNTRVVVIGATLLGIAAGVVGTFAYLRKRSLMGDALSHATLPGVAAAFLIVGAKSLPALLLGATITGVMGVMAVVALRHTSRLKEDAAIGIVLSVFFGGGLVLLSVIQGISAGQEAGLQSFIYGKAAAMLQQDARLIAGTLVVVIIGAVLLFKEFRLLCFDQAYTASLGWSVAALDLLMMLLVVLTTVVGLQAVGMILVVALLIIPAASARFWTDSLIKMVVLAGGFGAVSGGVGAVISALAPRLPTGALIVITAGAVFLVSMFFAPHRGIVAVFVRHWTLRRKVSEQHLLRAMAEVEEREGEEAAVTLDELLRRRSWSRPALRGLIHRSMRAGQLGPRAGGRYALTAQGRIDARRVLRNHRLWEMYLIRYADIAPSHVDRDADEVEHVLSPAIIAELDAAIAAKADIPPSPHVEVAPT